ncbi:MAG: carbohydrate binding domain-containing protein, partial [Lachnospiraceae bacterium]|nr:carbohydrate binding domain-containing protein [Lachnospiraceae bacterium]
AFWMMPQDEDYYGQWPKCGEIDIMEVLGDSTKNLYGTVHYGEPHEEQQGTYSLKSGDFASEYHVFAVDWEPGKITWYVDGQQYFEANNWFTKVSGEDEKPYPAPFDQPFHVILNVAVGGNWPGDPDDTTIFDDRAAMKVDYVRIFQRDSYDENVTKPVEVLDMREADETGNFVYNSSFEEEDLNDDENWKFLLFNGGEGEAKIENGEIVISSTVAGTEEYSVQLVQPQMPMEKGKKYKFTFEAYAEEAREMKAAVTAPDAGWIRYFPDTTVELDTDWQTYEFEFDMTEKSDDNGRVEFNMGKTDSTATIHIKNVRLEIVE